jgi:hypothetical protein
VALAAGGYVLGVRFNSHRAGDLIRRLFAERIVEGADPPNNLSVWLASPTGKGQPRPLHRFYETYSCNLRSRSAGRVLDLLWHELDSWDVRAESRLLIDATVLASNGRAHILGKGWRRIIAGEERRWRREGLQLIDRRWVDLDPVRGTVSLAPSGLILDGEAPGAFDWQEGPSGSADQSVAGILPIASWHVEAYSRSLASRVVGASAFVLDRTSHDGVWLIETLATLMERLPDVGAGARDVSDLRAALRDV